MKAPFFVRLPVFVFGLLLSLSIAAGPIVAAEASKPPAAPSTPAAAPASAKQSGEHEHNYKGQADLDAAIAAKVATESLSLEEYAKVIELCDRAILRGLDPENKKFAQRLVASTRVERATKIGDAIFGSSPPDPRWPQFRRMALADLDLALADDPANAQGQLLVARLEALPGGDAKQAAIAVAAALRLSEDNPIVRSAALVVRGDMGTDKKQRLADYNEALKLQPESVAALRARGFFFLTSDQMTPAKVDLAKAVELEPDHVATQEALALVLMLTKDYDDSIKHFTRAIELAPDDPAAYANRARVLALEGKNDKALADIERALKLSPDDLSWVLLRATILQQAGRTDEALADVNKLISQKPDLIEAVRTRARLLAASNKLPQAIAGLERATISAPNDLELAADLAMLYEADKKPRKAIAVYDKVIARGIKLPQLYHGRADAYLGIGRHKEAIADYNEVLKEDPQNNGVLNNLAWVLATSPDAKLRDGHRAIELATRACQETDYKAAHILSTLAAAYAETGDFKNAIKWSKKSLEVSDDPAAGDIKDDSVREALKKELAHYEAGKPTRELLDEEKDESNSAPPKKTTDKPADKENKKLSSGQK